MTNSLSTFEVISVFSLLHRKTGVFRAFDAADKRDNTFSVPFLSI